MHSGTSTGYPAHRKTNSKVFCFSFLVLWSVGGLSAVLPTLPLSLSLSHKNPIKLPTPTLSLSKNNNIILLFYFLSLKKNYLFIFSAFSGRKTRYWEWGDHPLTQNVFNYRFWGGWVISESNGKICIHPTCLSTTFSLLKKVYLLARGKRVIKRKHGSGKIVRKVEEQGKMGVSIGYHNRVTHFTLMFKFCNIVIDQITLFNIKLLFLFYQ